MILIIGTYRDPHIDAVRARLDARGARFCVFDPYAPENSAQLCFALSERIELRSGAADLIPQEVHAIWWRLKPFGIIPSGSATALYDYQFRQQEWGHFLGAVEERFEASFWMNRRHESRLASSKPRQLRIAQSLGLRIPRTLLTNDAQAAAAFAEAVGEHGAIFKPFTPYLNPNGAIAYSRRLDPASIRAESTSLGLCPGIFQEFVPKSWEVRVTIVGRDIFCTRIDSNRTAATQEDWRREIHTDLYREDRLPEEIAQKLLRLHAAFGLSFGAYDLIVDREGEHVFLEVNPSGQWLWLENATGQAISAAVADTLIAESKNAEQHLFLIQKRCLQ